MKEETLDVVRQMVADGQVSQEVAEKYFPELAEGESERIRKDMIETIKKEAHDFPSSIIAEKSNSWLSWLEKQGSNKLEKYINDERNKKDFYYASKEMSWNEIPLAVRKNDYPYYFKGDLDCYPFNVEKQGEQKSYASETMNEKGDFDNGFTRMMEKEQKLADKVEPKFKAGDWVVRGKTIAQILDIQEQYYIGLDINGNDFTSSRFLNDNKIHLWTIQDVKAGDVLAAHECLALFKEIDGWNIKCYCTYHFMNNPKFYVDTLQNKDAFHPATKEQRDLLFQKMKENGYEWDAEKKELKKIITPIFHIGDRVRYKGHACDGVITEITDTDYICGNAKLPISTQNNLELVEQKPADKIEPSAQNKSWSEEDEEIHRKCICAMRASACGFPEEEKFVEQVDNWLKSLKLQNRWKPSEEQLKSLKEVIDVGHFTSYPNALETLYEQLKKLK